jgi:large subunit ribosomal protein L16
MLMPRKVKHRKHHRGRTGGMSKGATELAFGEYGIQALEPGWLTARQIEAVRQCINRQLNRRGKIWVTIFPHIPVTSKPTENRMGKGKGSISYWTAPTKIGTILFEITGVPFLKAKNALLQGANKLPIKTKVIFR